MEKLDHRKYSGRLGGQHNVIVGLNANTLKVVDAHFPGVAHD